MKEEIIYLQHQDIDKVKWDKAISSASNGLIYAQSWYLDLVSPHWHALVNSDYSLLMPLTHRKKYGVHYLFQPSFVQQLGLFATDKTISSSTLNNFLRAIPESYRYIDFYLNHKNKIVADNISGLRIQSRLTHHLSLTNSSVGIRRKYSENLKRNLKKALSNNLIVENSVSIEEAIDLFRKSRGATIKEIGKTEYSLLKSIIRAVTKRNLITAYGVKKEGKLIAAAFFLQSFHEYIFFFSATGEEGKKNGAMSYIIDHFIAQHINEKMMLDFEGSMDKNLARFYKSFGAAEVVYLHIQQNTLPKLFRWLKK